MSDKQKLGDNLVLALSDLGNCDDCSYMETGSFELFGETEEGLECSIEIDVAEMCTEAAETIQDLEKQLEAKEKETEGLKKLLLMAHHVLDHGTVSENIIARAEIMAAIKE